MCNKTGWNYQFTSKETIPLLLHSTRQGMLSFPNGHQILLKWFDMVSLKGENGFPHEPILGIDFVAPFDEFLYQLWPVCHSW